MVTETEQPPTRRKITLAEQAELADYLANMALRPGDKRFGASVYVHEEQIDDLRSIAQTLRLFDRFGGAEFLKRAMAEARRR